MVQTDKEFLEYVMWEYHTTLRSIYAHYKRGYISEDEMRSRRYLNLKWFSLILHHHTPAREVPEKDLSPEYKTLYDNKEGFPLCAVIFYRDHEIPCYDDDYGQQVFADYKGHEWSGGAYNLCYGEEFCRCLDTLLDDELWQEFEAEYESE